MLYKLAWLPHSNTIQTRRQLGKESSSTPGLLSTLKALRSLDKIWAANPSLQATGTEPLPLSVQLVSPSLHLLCSNQPEETDWLASCYASSLYKLAWLPYSNTIQIYHYNGIGTIQQAKTVSLNHYPLEALYSVQWIKVHESTFLLYVCRGGWTRITMTRSVMW